MFNLKLTEIQNLCSGCESIGTWLYWILSCPSASWSFPTSFAVALDTCRRRLVVAGNRKEGMRKDFPINDSDSLFSPGSYSPFNTDLLYRCQVMSTVTPGLNLLDLTCTCTKPAPAQRVWAFVRVGYDIPIPAGIRVLRGDQHANATLQTSETRQDRVATTRAQQVMTTLYSIFELVWRD